jgi:pfkB family carbohydrate kinase
MRRRCANLVGPAVPYAIGQGAIMVSAAWGVFVWCEFASAPSNSRRLLPFMFVLFLLGWARLPSHRSGPGNFGGHMTEQKIVVVGSINLDLVASVARLPCVGEMLTGLQFATYSGGKGANQAVRAARLGGNVSIVGRLGEDSFAGELREPCRPQALRQTASRMCQAHPVPPSFL